jgi:uncharacterized protein (TIGR03067 family)
MKSIHAWGLLLSLFLTPHLMSSDNQSALEQEYLRFEGVWAFDLVEVEGKKQPEAPFPANKMIVVAAERRFVVIQGPKITRGVFQLDPTKTPKQIDVIVTTGDGKSFTTLSIYELEGDVYKVCASFKNGERPTELRSQPGSGTVFEVLKRGTQNVRDALAELDRSAVAKMED